MRRTTTPGDDFAVSRFPQPDGISFMAKHNCVIPTPDHCIRAARHVGDSHQVTGRDPLNAWLREMRCVSNGDNLAPGQDLADVFLDTEHVTAAESWRIQSVSGRTDHSTRVLERLRASLGAKG